MNGLPIGSDQIGPQIDLRARFPEERRSLLATLGQLDREAWNSPTSCPGWSVGDIAAHILGDLVGRVSAGRDRWHRSTPRVVESLADVVDQNNEEWVRAWRRVSPELVTELIEWAGAALDDHWVDVDLEAPALGVPWAGIDPAPAWFDIAREFTEYWIHHQQIRDAVGAGDADPAMVAVVLDVFARGLPYALRDNSHPCSRWVSVIADGPALRGWVLQFERGGWGISAESAPAGALEVRYPAKFLWRRWVRDPQATIDGIEQAGRIHTAIVDHVAIIRS